MRLLAFSLLGFAFALSFIGHQNAPAAEWLVNGDFEDTSGVFPNGWEIEAGTVYQTSGFNGTATGAAFLPNPWGGRIRQGGIEVGEMWQLDLMIASSDPGGNSDRSLNMILGDGTSGHINMRINGDGNIQAYNGAWQDLIAGGITFSQDSTGDGDFDDPGDLLNMQRMRIVGDYSSDPVYTVSLTAPGSTDYTMTSGAVNYFNYGTPASGRGIDMVTIKSDSSPGGFVVDEVSLTGEEAPPPPPFPGLVNGDFEDTTEPFPAGWTIVSGAPVQQTGLNGSDTALFLHKKSAGGDRISQSFEETTPEWDLDFYFASEEPLSAGDRALNLILNTASSAILNLRVEKSGNLQAHNGSAWVDLIPDAVTFSLDANADGDFDDAGDELNIHHMHVAGDATEGTFTIDISSANEDDFALNHTSTEWANTPGTYDGISLLTLSASSSTCTGSSAIDDLLLTDSTSIVNPQLPGDANGDNAVDVSDLGILATNYGAGGGKTWAEADFTGDGIVNVSDLGILATNYGATAASAVPEPGLLVLLIGSLAAVLAPRRFR